MRLYTYSFEKEWHPGSTEEGRRVTSVLPKVDAKVEVTFTAQPRVRRKFTVTLRRGETCYVDRLEDIVETTIAEPERVMVYNTGDYIWNKIDCIKDMRIVCNLGLVEAKQLVEALAAQKAVITLKMH